MRRVLVEGALPCKSISVDFMWAMFRHFANALGALRCGTSLGLRVGRENCVVVIGLDVLHDVSYNVAA